ncbi:CapA family protein [Candidatus Nomurabacteria bacterium]|nr:CapA family protein [Candidatus Nomurabacteria bacterium]
MPYSRIQRLSKQAGVAAVALVAAFGLAQGTAEAPHAFISQQNATDILFLGDVMLDRGVARRAATTTPGLGGGAMVSGMQPLVHSADVVVLNFEGTITTNPSIAQQDNTILRFTFTPELAKTILEALEVDVVSLANNHALDFYAAGYESTKTYLDEWGIGHFGHPLNSQHLSTIFEHEGRVLCFVGYHELYDANTASVVAEIIRLRPECTKIIVFPHWGPEYEPLPSASQVSEAHAFIDAGADMVIGAHPHVVQPIEVYNGKPIAYSLGNFIFDQDFSWETRHGLALMVRLRDEGTRITLIPIAIEGSRPSPALGEERTRIIEAAGGVDTLELP